MRMAHILGAATQGGAEGFFERLVPALATAGDTVLPIIRREPGRVARLSRMGVPPEQLPFGNLFDFGTGRRLAGILRSFSPEVVVSWQNRASSYAGRVRQRGADWTLVGRLGGYYDLKYYRHCDHLVGNTRDLRKWFIAQGWPEARAHYVPNFAEDFSYAASADWPRPDAGPRLLAVGRLHRNKAFDVLLHAMAALPTLTLCIAGDGPERKSLQTLAEQLGMRGRVTFLGWRSDVGGLMKSCDIFVCPSRHEPLGNVVLEAWSAAKPIIAAAAQGPSELIQNGLNGVLVPPENATVLAAAISELVSNRDLAETLAANGRREFVEHHSERPVLAKWRAFLHGVGESQIPAAAAQHQAVAR